MNTPFNSRTKTTVDNWETPPDFFDIINKRFHFTLDVCASNTNTKCFRFYDEEKNGLAQNWEGEIVFCNPPYNKIDEWTKKCFEEGQKDDTVIALLTKPATETKRWYQYIMKASKVIFLTPRINFLKNGVKPSKNGSNFPSILVIFERHEGITKYMSFNWKSDEGCL